MVREVFSTNQLVMLYISSLFVSLTLKLQVRSCVAFGVLGVMQDLVVGFVSRQVGAVLADQGAGHAQAFAGEGLIQFITDLGDVEVAHHNDIFVYRMLFLATFVDPIGKKL